MIERIPATFSLPVEGRVGRRLLWLLAVSGQDNGDREHAWHRLHCLFARLPQGFLGFACFGIDLDCETNVAVLYDDARNHTQADHVLALILVHDVFKSFQDVLFGNFAHRSVTTTSYATTACLTLANCRLAKIQELSPIRETAPAFRTGAAGSIIWCRFTVTTGSLHVA